MGSGMTLHEHQQNEVDAQLHREAMIKTIPGLADNKYYALSAYCSKPGDPWQWVYVQDVAADIAPEEWISILVALRSKDTSLAGELLDQALKRICLQNATNDVEDKL